ncbi:uncharacterized protein LOC124795977 [Schistocerca piceifrons]|uniref:uncharacterized protein LOC124795977 n=1 Tax=Schistocerca piceifrons TaxID=274613 RepID=UPI001F5F034B|nr:uncharacterized protein LOC124795977 [Schistocerca piceifrons]
MVQTESWLPRIVADSDLGDILRVLHLAGTLRPPGTGGAAFWTANVATFAAGAIFFASQASAMAKIGTSDFDSFVLLLCTMNTAGVYVLRLIHFHAHSRIIHQLAYQVLVRSDFSAFIVLIEERIWMARGSLGDILKYVAYMSVMVTELGVYCWFGNELITESEAVAESACYCAHGARPVALRRGLLLVAVRAGRPLSISAGPLYVFCREAFVSVSSSDTL